MFLCLTLCLYLIKDTDISLTIGVIATLLILLGIAKIIQSKEEKQEKLEKTEKQNEEITELGEVLLEENEKQYHIQLLSVIGEVEGHECLPNNSKTTKYEHVLPKLAMIEDSREIDGLLILLNTVGGDVEAGLAIAEMIASLSKPTVSLVLGGGHSIGVPLAVSADYSFIVPSATMVVHPVRSNGMFIGVYPAIPICPRSAWRN